MKPFSLALLLLIGLAAGAATSQPATQNGQAARGLQLSLSAESTELRITVSENEIPKYTIKPTRLALTFTNTSDEPIKLDLYDVAWSKLKIEVTGPDAESVAINDKRSLIERELVAPTEKHYPVIEPGKSYTLPSKLTFPGMIGGVEYSLRKPGEFRVKITYTAAPLALDVNGKDFAKGSWSGTLTSNEITLKAKE